MLLDQLVVRRHYAFETMEGNHPCSHRHFLQLFTQDTVVVTVQIRGAYDAVINSAGVQQVLIKGIIKVKMVEGLKMQVGKVPMKKVRVVQAQDISGRLGMSHEVAALFDAKKGSVRPVISSGQNKLPYPATDIQYPEAG